MLRRSSFTWAIILGVTLLTLVVTMLVFWIIGQAATQQWLLLTVGIVFLSLILVGVVLYLVLSIKEINLNRRQANFIDSVTHELKSPIASIKLCLQTLDMRTVAPDQQREFHRFMQDDIQRLDSLIDHLLAAAKINHDSPPERLVPIPLETTIRGCADMIMRRYSLEPDQLQLDIKPCVVQGLQHDLEMVCSNLFDNAVKYGGKPPRVLVSLAPHGKGRVRIRVCDNGPGIRFELRRQIFRRFFRGGQELERTTKGTGLGLFIVRAIVKKLGGNIHVHGRGPLPGATFDVDLPGEAVVTPPDEPPSSTTVATAATATASPRSG